MKDIDEKNETEDIKLDETNMEKHEDIKDDKDIEPIDLDDYMDLIEDDTEKDEDEETEKEDEDIGEIGGKLKKTGPFLIGGLLTIVVIAVVACTIAFFIGKKDDDESSSGMVGVSANDVDTLANASGNNSVYISVSSNNSATIATDALADTDPYAYVTEDSDDGLTVADVTTSNTLAVLSREFLDTEDYPDITELISEYFTAYASCDLGTILSLVDYNGGTQITQEELDERAEIVEGYQNLEFYIIEGMDTSSYVVYAAYDIKFYNIDTGAPTLTRFYVVTGDDGVIHIYNGEVTAKLNAYLNSVNEYDCVQELSDSIDEGLIQACEVDETLKTLMEILYGSEE